MTLRSQWCGSLAPDDLPPTAYDELLDRLPHATPFNRLAWLRGAALALPPGAELQVLHLWQGERLVGCLPLVRQRERRLGIQWTTLRLLGYPLSDRLALAFDPAVPAAAQLAYAEIQRQLPHDLLELDELTVVDQPIFQLWRSEAAQGRLRLNCQVPIHRLQPDDAAEPSGPVRYKLRRAKKRCAELGAQILRLAPSADTWPALAERLREVETLSWKGTDGVGIFSGHERQRWMQEALLGLARENRVRVVLLEHQGRCLSYRLGFLQDGRLYDYNLAFHPDHAALGSGRLLLDEWLRWGLDDGWAWIDASRVSLHNSSHQLHERQSHSCAHWRWSLYNRTLKGRLLALFTRGWHTFKHLRNRVRARAATQES